MGGRAFSAGSILGGPALCRIRFTQRVGHPPLHWLIVFAFFGATFIGIPYLGYRHGRKVGDQEGYIRGYKEGQQSVSRG